MIGSSLILDFSYCTGKQQYSSKPPLEFIALSNSVRTSAQIASSEISGFIIIFLKTYYRNSIVRLLVDERKSIIVRYDVFVIKKTVLLYHWQLF